MANCCALKVNRVNFGIENIVAPMVSYLSCDDEEIKRHTVRALHYLSSEPANCVAMHQNGSVKVNQVSLKYIPTLRILHLFPVPSRLGKLRERERPRGCCRMSVEHPAHSLQPHAPSHATDLETLIDWSVRLIKIFTS